MIALLLPLWLCQSASDADNFHPERTVVIGDSQAEGLKSARVLPKLGVAIHAFAGRPSVFFLRWLENHPEAVAGKDLVVFQLGGNDISAGESAERIASNMVQLARMAKRMNPGAEVVFSAIPVRGQWFDAQKRKNKLGEQEDNLDRVNAWIAAGHHPDFATFAFNSVIADPAAPRLQRVEFKRQGADVHLNRHGYNAVSVALLGALARQ